MYSGTETADPTHCMLPFQDSPCITEPAWDDEALGLQPGLAMVMMGYLQCELGNLHWNLDCVS